MSQRGSVAKVDEATRSHVDDGCSSGNVKQLPLPDIWRDSRIFAELRDDGNLEGKCGCCEFKTVCMGCRARAYADTGSYLAEEPNCGHTPVRIARAAAR